MDRSDVFAAVGGILQFAAQIIFLIVLWKLLTDNNVVIAGTLVVLYVIQLIMGIIGQGLVQKGVSKGFGEIGEDIDGALNRSTQQIHLLREDCQNLSAHVESLSNEVAVLKQQDSHVVER